MATADGERKIPKRLGLVADLLDKQLVDEEGNLLGRADGIVLSLDGDGAPEVEALAQGFVVLAGRVHPRALRLVEWLRRWSVRRTARWLIPWEKVTEVNRHHLQLAVAAAKAPAFDWERFLSRRVVAHVPGESEHEEAEKGKP